MPNENFRVPNDPRGQVAATFTALRYAGFTWIVGLLAGMARGAGAGGGRRHRHFPGGESLRVAIPALYRHLSGPGRLGSRGVGRKHAERGGKRGHAIAGVVISSLATIFCGLCFLVVSVMPTIKAEIAKQQAAQQGNPYPRGSTSYGRSRAPAPAPVETELEAPRKGPRRRMLRGV